MLSETVYSSDVSDDPRSAGLSPRVAALATNFFDELQVLINAYGNEAVDRLTPMIVSVLENLDNAFSESHDYLIKLEEVDEDKQQLLAQYEREKQLRKIAEEKYLAVEDNLEEDKRELENQLESNNKQSRQLDGKCKALIQQGNSLIEISL
ncbi:uncharacterized protein TRIADDRAFT_25965 [Trichoplax adhaerens]|uniref:RH1 domain-containing protein n=1 Tax=Trichoplax adhaerens TaxID=10228 RepID=B3RXM2_TRIAD|nr:hypothetical protein TRIADDRAFT_25965 [Trichoplax adhaerens]EDV24884.1 hypothetical protein TRIADDRAFT_25965 [Trichoplax adhaerens]|eukprot:XP_002112774.1 hypothetical protein TRIADDRAFT_25965 [Trichoplax adhaerens]